ncbi:MAG: hypothetical protein II938_04340 [Alphaproteobacteria bacterium]|nr:hypothetical protein [Alphaproteobacteria bacterium]
MTKKCESALTAEEKKKLKQELHTVWPQFPLDLRKVIFEAKKHKLNIMYMIENWAEENHNQILVELLSRKIACSEKKLKEMEKELEA